AEAAGIAHGGDEFGAAQIRPHRRSDDWMFDAQRVAKSRFHKHLLELTTMFSWSPQISAFCSPVAWRFRCNSYLVLMDDRFVLENFPEATLPPFTSFPEHFLASERGLGVFGPPIKKPHPRLKSGSHIIRAIFAC